MASRLPDLAATLSLAISSCIFEAAPLNLSRSVQILGSARVSPLSVPSTKPAYGSLEAMVAISALSAAAFASNGIRPLAIAATRPKWVAITVKAALRYLIASSGFANCAAAGIATPAPAIAAAAIHSDENLKLIRSPVGTPAGTEDAVISRQR